MPNGARRRLPQVSSGQIGSELDLSYVVASQVILILRVSLFPPLYFMRSQTNVRVTGVPSAVVVLN